MVILTCECDMVAYKSPLNVQSTAFIGILRAELQELFESTELVLNAYIIVILNDR